ncbi:MAG: ATP-binding cassette domain-containing protein, partial [Gammaproteobacteria bacterium]
MAELKSADPKLKTNRYTTRTEQVNFEELTFVDVGLGHNRAQPALVSGVNFTIRRGEWIGIIGDSGSGKTTLIDTMLGLLEPQGGEILFNTQPLQSVLSNWQSKVAYIPQETLILDASLAQNVALGKGADQRLRDVLKKARLDDLVDSLPQGVKERLGERGALISGGQRQRVALA